MTYRPEIRGQRGIVAGGRHYSVAAGTRILKAGGNAVDAGVATVFAAAVVEISHFGFGGEAPTIICDRRSGEVVVINGQGPAPLGASPELFASRGSVDGNGPLAATIPAVMDAMAIALERFGTLRLAEVMAPAIELADGFPMYGFLRELMITHRRATEQWEWSKRTYYPDNEVCQVGELFRQANLAATLRAIVAAESTEYAWWGLDLPARVHEPRQPDASDIEAKVVMATAASWEAKSRWFFDVNRDQFEVTPAIREKVEAILSDAGVARSDEELKAKASHIVSGTVIAISAKTQKSTVERGFGIHRDRVFTIDLKVATVSEGEGVEGGQVIQVKA